MHTYAPAYAMYHCNYQGWCYGEPFEILKQQFGQELLLFLDYFPGISACPHSTGSCVLTLIE